jgi:hypothetical protein
MWTRLAAGVRNALVWLLNVVVAVFGTAIVETPFSRLFHPHSMAWVLIKGDTFSAIIAFALGFFVYRQWKPAMARWVGGGGILWLVIGVILSFNQGTLWEQMSGTECAFGLIASGCWHWFFFTLPALRMVLYSFGALLCWRFGAYGTSAVEDALLVRFPHQVSDNRKID